MSLLSQQTKLKELAKWNRLADTWSMTVPPAIPSKDDIYIFQECLKKYKTRGIFRVVVLGSTIELRRIFLDNPELLNTEVWCIDWSERMYSRFTEIGQINNPNERFICEDWQKFELAENSVDAIIGDRSIDNVPYPLWEGLFKHLRTKLRPGGGLILHVGLNTKQFVGVSFESALARWTTELKTGNINLETATSGLWEDLISGSSFVEGTDPRICSLSKYASDISSFQAKLSTITDSTMMALFQELVHLFGPSFNDEWTAFTMDEIVESSSTFFDVRGVYYSKDYEAAPSTPIIEFIKPI